MHMCEQGQLHDTSQLGGRHPWVSMCMCGCALKMTEQVEQGVCIKFCFNLEHSSMETILVIQKAAAMGNL